MAEKRFINYKKPLTALDDGQRFVGLFEPGRYRGFDDFSYSGLTASINHGNKGVRDTLIDLSQTVGQGVLVSTQGTVIKYDEGVDLPITPNSSNLSFRNDLVVMSHEFVEVAGGQASVISILEGPFDLDEMPTVSSTTEVIIGHIRIPPGATDLSGAVYKPWRARSLGGEEVAFIKETNQFLAMQQFNKSQAIPIYISPLNPQPVADTHAIANMLCVEGDTNSLSQLRAIHGVQEGSLVMLKNTGSGNITILSNIAPLNVALVTAGYAPFATNLNNLVLEPQQILLLVFEDGRFRRLSDNFSIPAVNAFAQSVNSEWVEFNVLAANITASSGTMTRDDLTGYYKIIGKTLHIIIRVPIQDLVNVGQIVITDLGIPATLASVAGGGLGVSVPGVIKYDSFSKRQAMFATIFAVAPGVQGVYLEPVASGTFTIPGETLFEVCFTLPIL